MVLSGRDVAVVDVVAAVSAAADLRFALRSFDELRSEQRKKIPLSILIARYRKEKR